MARQARHAPEPPPPIEGRVPPNDLDAEAAVLSAILVEPRALDRVHEFLLPEHFYSEAHRRIFEAAADLHARGQPVDAVTVASHLRDRDRLAQIGGIAYLTEVMASTPAIANVEAYAKTIHEKARVRNLISTCQRIAAEGYVDYGEAQGFIDGAEQAVYHIARTSESTSVEHIKLVIKKAITQVSEAASRGDQVTGIPTGFDRLDRMMAGLHPGDLSIVAARPGMGKTSLVLNMAANVATPRYLDQGNGAAPREVPGAGTVVFSLEMPREQLANRMLCSEARVDVSKIRTGHLVSSDWSKLTTAAARLTVLPLWIDDSPGLSILELRSKVRRLQAEYDRTDDQGRKTQKIGLVVVDYLQLMKGREGAASREQEISEISRGLKQLAKELRVSVIALSQLNRAVETRSEKSKKPQLSDLRESGAIEQDADNILFIYRDAYYNADTNDKNIAEIIVAKQRNGPTGTVKVRFDREYTRFDNLPEGEYEDED